MVMKGKMVHPDKRKGQVYIYQSDDTLMHFCWKDRTTGNVEEVSNKNSNIPTELELFEACRYAKYLPIYVLLERDIGYIYIYCIHIK